MPYIPKIVCNTSTHQSINLNKGPYKATHTARARGAEATHPTAQPPTTPREQQNPRHEVAKYSSLGGLLRINSREQRATMHTHTHTRASSK